jgi:Uma2 family endonuclease
MPCSTTRPSPFRRLRKLSSEPGLGEPREKAMLPVTVDPAVVDDTDVYYRSSDGRPMGETDWHVQSIITLFENLKVFLEGRNDAYVAANMFLYYEKGNPKANRAPDCMVMLGVKGNHPRRSLKTWTEGVVPSVIFEFSSDDTFSEDLGPKRELYQRLGVSEYFLFDPLGECLDPQFQGLRLVGSEYSPIRPGDDRGLESQALGLRFVPKDFRLEVFEPGATESMPDLIESLRRLRVQTERAQRVSLQAEEAERRAQDEHCRAKEAQMRAEAERRRADVQERQVEEQKRQAEEQKRQAEEQKQRADLLEVELERLRAVILHGKGNRGVKDS